MKIIADKNNRPKHHQAKHEYWEKEGIEVVSDYRLSVGDYILSNPKVEDMIERKVKRGIPVKIMDFMGTYDLVVDTKSGMQEMYSDIVGKDHERFRDSCILAQNNNIRLVVLIEEPGINTLEDVAKWKNPRAEKWYKFNALHKQGKALSVKIPKIPPTPSATLMKSMQTMTEKYGVEFQFCDPIEAGRRVLEILEGD